MATSRLVRHPVLGAVFPVGSRRRALAVASVRRVVPAARPKPPTPEQRGPTAERPGAEEDKLKKVWAGYNADGLEVYLVTGYQDPRINAQSILARHALVRALFGSEFDVLMREELLYAVELNEAMRVRAAELGVRLVNKGPEALANKVRVGEVIADRAPIFGERWRAALADREAPPLSVLEFACGSANDYRAFADYGIARFLDYTGIDLNETNIANAKRRFPDINFRVDSILSLPEADHSIDYVIGFDILEHLSPAAKRTAMDAAVRICRRGLHFALFAMDENPDDIVRPVRNYHVNILSAPRMRDYMGERFDSVQLINIRELLTRDFGAKRSFNRRAVTLVAEGLKKPS
jgi:SAM-dependent methyltransferase